MSAPTVTAAAVSADRNWISAVLSDNTAFALLTNPRAPGAEPAWVALPTLPAGTPVDIGITNGGAACVLVMSDGACHELSLDPLSAGWRELPAIPGTDAAD